MADGVVHRGLVEREVRVAGTEYDAQDRDQLVRSILQGCIGDGFSVPQQVSSAACTLARVRYGGSYP